MEDWSGRINLMAFLPPETFSEHLLAGCPVLLSGYDGKVTSNRSEAGEDLDDRKQRLNV